MVNDMKKVLDVVFEKILFAVGIVGICFWSLGAVATASKGERDTVPFCIVAVLIGVAMCIAAQRKKKLRNRAEVYAMCIADKPEAELSEIARTMNIPLEKVVSELDELIAKDYLNNIYIDRTEGRVKILSDKKGGPELKNGYRFVACKNCGASNRIVGSADGRVCSYCKAPLSEHEPAQQK